MIDVQKLRRLAQAATPGPWKMLPVGDGRQKFAVADSEFLSILTVTDEGGATFGTVYDDADAKFIAAANPAAIIELLDRLEASEADGLEQARLNGMGSEREAALMAKLEAAEQTVQYYLRIDREKAQIAQRLEAAEKDVALKERVIDALGSELAAVAKERAVMRSLVVMRFDHDHPPQFTQGYDTHEFAEPVTAEHCRWFVAEIERLRAELSAAKEAAAYHAHQTNEVSVALAASDAKIAEMKKQEPVAEMVEDEFGKYVKGINYWRHLQNGTKLYAFPGTKGE